MLNTYLQLCPFFLHNLVLCWVYSYLHIIYCLRVLYSENTQKYKCNTGRWNSPLQHLKILSSMNTWRKHERIYIYTTWFTEHLINRLLTWINNLSISVVNIFKVKDKQCRDINCTILNITITFLELDGPFLLK